MPTILNNLLRRIRERSRPGVSLTKVALELGVQKEYLSRVELGTQNRPSEEVLGKMMDVYGCGPGLRRAVGAIWRASISIDLPEDAEDPSDPLHLVLNYLHYDEPGLVTLHIRATSVEESIIQRPPGVEEDRARYLIYGSALLFEFLDVRSWLHQDYAYKQFQSLLLQEPRRIYVNSFTGKAGGDCVIFPSLICINLGYPPLVKYTSDPQNLADRQAQFDHGSQKALTPRDAIEFMDKLRDHAIALGHTVSHYRKIEFPPGTPPDFPVGLLQLIQHDSFLVPRVEERAHPENLPSPPAPRAAKMPRRRGGKRSDRAGP